jgi:hypothetical protein
MATKMWPTPTGMTGGEGVAPSHKNGTHGWNTAAAVNDAQSPTPVQMWPTPTTRDHKGANSDEHLAKERGHHDQLPNAVKMAGHRGGQLNPDWVEWLMGYPTGWTDLKPSEMPLSRKSSSKSEGQSSRRKDER